MNLLEKERLRKIWVRIATKLSVYPNNSQVAFMSLSRSQMDRLGGLAEMAAKHDPAAWRSKAWRSQHDFWLAGMHTRRIQSLRRVIIHEHLSYMEPIIPYFGLIANMEQLAVDPLPIKVHGTAGTGNTRLAPQHGTFVVYDDLPSLGDLLSEALRNNDLRKAEHAMGVHTVEVRFVSPVTGQSSNKTYHYLTRLDFEAGEYATVWSPITDAPAVVRVVQVYRNSRLHSAFKYIIDKVDMAAHREAVRAAEARDQAIRDQRNYINSLNSEINRRKQAIDQEIKEAAYAKDSILIELNERIDWANTQLNKLEQD